MMIHLHVFLLTQNDMRLSTYLTQLHRLSVLLIEPERFPGSGLRRALAHHYLSENASVAGVSLAAAAAIIQCLVIDDAAFAAAFELNQRYRAVCSSKEKG